jgi:predicted nucleotidyltransferase
MNLKELQAADVAEIQKAVTDELKKVQKIGIFGSFCRNCKTTQKPVYMPI